MTVSELIGELQKYPKDAQVHLEVYGYVQDASSVDYCPTYVGYPESVIINSEG